MSRLPELARNILWTWRPQTQALFSRLDPELWESTEHNLVRLLNETQNLGRAAEDPGIVALYELAVGDLDRYLDGQGTWTGHVYPRMDASVAYFSAGFGLHESLPIYSGGLGVLAGDHVKSASDLGLVGVGILHAQGYFRQRINAEGRQEEVYELFEPGMRPIAPRSPPTAPR